MKKLHLLIVMISFAFFGIQNSNAQSVNEKENTVYKTSKVKTPEKVKLSLKEYADYKISNEVTFTKKSKGNVYKFKVQKGNWSHFLLIDESGKIIGIETGEH